MPAGFLELGAVRHKLRGNSYRWNCSSLEQNLEEIERNQN